MQRSKHITAHHCLFRISCLLHHQFRLAVHERIQFWIQSLDAFQVNARNFHWRNGL